LHVHVLLLPQTTHQDAINSLQAGLQQAVAAQENLQEQLSTHEATIQQQLQQLQELQESIADLQSQLGGCGLGSPLCTQAAQLQLCACVTWSTVAGDCNSEAASMFLSPTTPDAAVVTVAAGESQA
jgi:septal ring factor EnvC (AmiA/AmiB activator)